jgi:hypothetical protein
MTDVGKIIGWGYPKKNCRPCGVKIYQKKNIKGQLEESKAFHKLHIQ